MPQSENARFQVPDTAPLSAAKIASTATFSRSTDTSPLHLIRIVNRRFLVTRIGLRYAGLHRPLIRETTVEECCIGGERDTESKITLEGWPSIETAQGSPSWTVVLQADGGDIAGEFYRAVLHGCCDESAAFTFVNLLTGTLAFVNSESPSTPSDWPAELQVPNSALQRYAAFQDRLTELDLPEGQGDSTVVGVLQYGSGREPAARFVLRHVGGRGLDYRLEKIEFLVAGHASDQSPVELWSADKKEDPAALSGFSIVLTFSHWHEDSTRTVRIPVSRDRPQLSDATMPPGLTWAEPARSR